MTARNSSSHRSSELGGGLVYVFIGIVLFAALAYTFSKGFNGSVSSSSRAASQAKAIEIMDYGSTLAKTVNKLLLNGCSINQINFKTDRYTRNPDLVNASAPVDGSCDVFYPGKGGVGWRNCPDPNLCNDPDVYDPFFPANTGVTGMGTAQEDLLFMVLVTPDVCDSINIRLGLPTTNLPSTTVTPSADLFQGTFSYAVQLPSTGSGTYAPFEKTGAGCMKVSNIGTNERVYYHILSVQ